MHTVAGFDKAAAAAVIACMVHLSFFVSFPWGLAPRFKHFVLLCQFSLKPLCPYVTCLSSKRNDGDDDDLPRDLFRIWNG